MGNCGVEVKERGREKTLHTDKGIATVKKGETKQGRTKAREEGRSVGIMEIRKQGKRGRGEGGFSYSMSE